MHPSQNSGKRASLAPPSPERPSHKARKLNRSTRIIKGRDDQTEEDDDSEDEAGFGTNNQRG